ncbi:MAG: antibiotic biosynthesis monooxygenase [Spirochaetia bacterium]|nr:antibiotic biosynthesis monooxygenase [Spirochaetia bacterium]
MVFMAVTYKCGTKENRSRFMAELLPLGANCRKEPGNVRYEYFLPVDDDTVLFLFEKWESEDAVKVHSATENFRQIVEVKARYSVVSEIEKIIS